MKDWLGSTTVTVSGGMRPAPGSSQSWPRSRRGSYIGVSNSGAAITGSSGSSAAQLTHGASRSRL